MAAATAVTNGFDLDSMHEAITAIRRKQVFFVGGAAKSGTTWLQFLLNARCHPFRLRKEPKQCGVALLGTGDGSLGVLSVAHPVCSFGNGGKG